MILTSDKNSEVPRNKQIGKDESQKGINAVYTEFVLQMQSRRVVTLVRYSTKYSPRAFIS